MRHVTTRNVELTDFAQMYRHMRMCRKLIERALYLRITIALRKLYRAMFHGVLAANKLILQVTNTCLILMFLLKISPILLLRDFLYRIKINLSMITR